MAKDTVLSQSITNLDNTAPPYLANSAGQGAAGRVIEVDDWVAATAAGLGTAGSYYKLVRVPTGAIIKSVEIATDKAPDSGASKLIAFDLNWIFSDSTIDGTQASLQGLIPTTGNTGATTTIATYSSPNKMYGQFLETSNTLAYGPTNLVFNGIGTTYNFLGLTQQPLWQTFGFVDGRGNPADPNGYFDLLLYVATAAGTAQACNIYAKVTYAI
jgi:hypothetical protein